MTQATLLTTLLALTIPTQDPHPAPGSRASTRPAPAADERVWEGYVFLDAQGRLQLGWPVVAMGVMATPAHLVGGALAERLRPLATATKDSHVFLNYALEQEGEQALAGVPRWLVTLRGRVQVAGEEAGGAKRLRFGSSGGEETMVDARLEGAELLADEWLRHWALFFRDQRSPFRIAKDAGAASPAERKEFAQKAVAALRAMRGVAGMDAARREVVAKLEPGARVSEKFRRRTEWSIQRSLVEMAAKDAFELPGLAELGPLPPSSVEIQRWFLEAKNKEELLARVAKASAAPPEDLELIHYVTDGASTTWATTDLRQVRDRWTEEQFRTHQDTTRKMAGGR